MASKKAKAAITDEELLAQFDELEGGDETASQTTKPASNKPPAKAAPPTQSQEEADLLAELDNLAQERPKSRPHTPRVGASVPPAAQASPKRASTATPPPGAQTRKSGESTRSFHQSFVPGEDKPAQPEPTKQAPTDAAPQVSGGGGWWGGIMATATAAVKQAEALAKEIQKNEEAQRWAEQVKGNVGVLRSYGMTSTHAYHTILLYQQGIH